jgi:hypothetical protein
MKNLVKMSHKSQRFLLTILIVFVTSQAFTQTSPVTVTTVLGYPPSIYLPDYYSSGKNLLTANLVLNDFNEPSRDVYLRVSIESQNLKIQTKPDYYPAAPITLYPGEVVPFSGSDFEEYLGYNNILIEGMTIQQLISRGGRMPEGLYTFCVEAYDYATRRLLSNTSCQVTQLAQNDPPSLLFPEKEAMIAPSTNQNIIFQWLNNAPISPSELVYNFTLYELIDPHVDPMQAIDNNQSIIIYEEETTTPIFTYNASYPLLETGKTYIYRVQVYTLDGKALFKNDGYSEPSYFYYGYPGNGNISLIKPEHNGALELTREKMFAWTAPDKLLAGQSYIYEIRIAKEDSLRTREKVLEDDIDSLHYFNTSSVRTGSMNYTMKVDQHFATGTNFVWQVKAFTDDQEIAKSRIQTFGGPPCIVDFLAADHYVGVTYTDGCNLKDISGTGSVNVDAEGNRHDVVFNNVHIAKEGVQYYLQSGEVLADVKDMAPIKLTPEYQRNGEAWFYPDSIKITRYDYFMKGHVEWSFPHAVDQDEAPVIRTVTDWIKYEDFKLLGLLPVKDSTSFELLDPMNFTIEFTEGSLFYMRGGNQYNANFNGNIIFPENVGDLTDVNTVVPFSNHRQVYNLHSDENISYSRIKVANRTTLTIQPTEFVFDLDNEASPKLFENDPLWRGFYINNGRYAFHGDMEFSKQFGANQEIGVDYNFDSSDSIHAYVVYDGLWAKTNIDFQSNNKLLFNTFPATVNEFSVKVEANETMNGFIEGGITIPLLDDDDFEFTSELTQYGFMPGYLHEEIENRTFEYNPDSEENLLLLTFHRGYFADNNRLETTITIDWPYLDISFENMPMFRIWGNYDIGFGGPNGAFSLAQQLQTRLKGFEVTIDGIGAGRQANAYAIGTTAKIVMAEDASGADGPPVVNFYSIFESSKIDEQVIFSGADEYDNTDWAENNESYNVDENIGKAAEGKAFIGDAEAILANYKSQMKNAEAQAEALIPRKKVGKEEPKDNLREDLKDYMPVYDLETVLDSPTDLLSYQELLGIIDFIAPFLEEEQQEKIQDFKELLVSFSPEEIEAFIEKFSDISGLLGGILQAQIDAQIAKYTKPLKDKVDTLNAKIERSIMQGTNNLVDKMEVGIDVPINGFVDLATNTVNASPLENKTPVLETINKVATSTRENLKAELRRTVTASVHKNIVVEATGIVDTILYTGTIGYLANSLSQNSAALITNPDFSLSDIDLDLDDMVEQNFTMLQNKISFEYFSDRITTTIDDAISGFNWDAVKDSILGDLLGGSVEAFIEEKITEAVSNALGETAGVVGGLAQNVFMDFSNLGQKLKDDDLSGIIKFDPSYIVIITPVVDMEGFVKFTNDDPIWGDSFQAMLNATIKKPVKLNAFAKYINGSKPIQDVTGMTDEEKKFVPTYKFWFLEAGVHGFAVPLTPIPIALTGFEGKIYHHMVRAGSNKDYVPSDSVRFGIGSRVFMADAASMGKVAAFDIGLELELVSGGFNLIMDGNAFIANTGVTFGGGGGGADAGGDGKGKELTLDRTIVLAEGFMHYNSIEKHFLATMNVELNTSPLLCAGGGMIIDISKDWWQFAIGTRDEPIKLSLLCKTDIFKGWFDINKSGLDIGIFTNIDINVQSPWINLGVGKFRGWAYFFFDFEAELLVSWSPDFGIQKGRIFVDIGAGVGIDWETLIKSGSFTIAAVNMGGELEFATIPEAYLRGEVHGSVTVLGCSAGVSMSADITF